MMTNDDKVKFQNILYIRGVYKKSACEPICICSGLKCTINNVYTAASGFISARHIF